MRKKTFMSLPMLALVGLVIPLGATASILLLSKSLQVRESSHYDEIIEGGEIFRDAVVSEDGSLMLVNLDNKLVAIETESTEVIWEWEGSHRNLSSFLISGDGSRIVWGFNRSIHDASTGEQIRHEPDQTAHLLAISRDGSRLAFVVGQTLHVEETDSGTSLFEYDFGEDYVHHLHRPRSSTFDVSGSQLAFHTRNLETLLLVDIDSGTVDQQPGPDHYFGAFNSQYSPQLDLLAYEDVGVGVVLMNYPDGEELLRYEFEDHLYDMRFSPGGEHLNLTIGHPSTRTFDHASIEIETGVVSEGVTRTRGELLGVYLRDGEPRYMESRRDSIQFLDASGNEDMPPLNLNHGFNLRVRHFQGGQKILVVDATGYHTIMDLASGDSESWEPLPWSTGYYSIRVAGDSDIAVMQSARAIISFDLTTREPLHSLRDLVYSEGNILDISMDGMGVAMGVRGNEEVILVNPRTAETLGTVSTGDPVFALALSRSGDYLALFHPESVSVLDTATGDIRHTQPFRNSFNPHKTPPKQSTIFHQPLANIAVSPDGDHVALFTERTTLWHLDLLEGVQTPVSNPEASDQDTSLAFGISHLHLEFSPDGHRLLVSPRMLDLFNPLRFGSQHMRGTILVDLRNYDKVREYLALPPGAPIPDEDPFQNFRMAEATFSPDGQRVVGLDWKSNDVLIHFSGIPGDDVELVTENLLSKAARLPATAPGVDVSGDGVLDAADIVSARK